MLNSIIITKKRILMSLPILIGIFLVLTTSIYGFSKIASANTFKKTIPDLKRVEDKTTLIKVTPTPLLTPTPVKSRKTTITNLPPTSTPSPMPTKKIESKSSDDYQERSFESREREGTLNIEFDKDIEDIHKDD